MGFRIPHVLMLIALLLWIGASQVMAGPSMLCADMPCSHQASADHEMPLEVKASVKDAHCAIACDLVCAAALLPQNMDRAGHLWRDLRRPHAKLYVHETERITPDRPPILI